MKIHSRFICASIAFILFLLEGRADIAGASTPSFDPQLISYRLQAKDLGFTVLENYHGKKIVVRIGLTNTTDHNITSSLRLNSERLDPFFPFIPPYVGLGARKFSAKLWVGSTLGLRNLRIVFDHAGIDFQTIPIDLSTLKPKQWNQVELADPKLGSVAQPLTGVRVESDLAPGAQGEVYLAEAILGTEAGRTYALLTTDMPLMLTGMSKPLATKPDWPLPKRDSLTFGGYDLQNPDLFADLPDMVKFMNERFPEVDFVIAPMWTPPPIVGALLPRLPAGVFYQFQKAQLDTNYLEALGGNPTNASGKTYNHLDNALVATNPLTQKALKDQIDYGASLGINNFKQVDFVWDWEGGRWGYDHASVDAFRTDLIDGDEGLDLLPGPNGEKAGVIHFWDYYEDYHGIRLKPADVGIQRWSDYKPASEAEAAAGNVETKKNLGIYILLYHYEYLRLTQRLGRWAKAVGGKHDYTLNSEDIGGGDDFVAITRLAAAGTPYFEYFGGPSVLRGAYHDLPFYIRAGVAAHKPQGLITEIGQGGHGENYLDSEVGYLYAYELAALGLHDYHSEWTESAFHVMSDPKNAYQYDRFSTWMSQAYGFRQARREGTQKPVPKVLNVTLRSVAHYISSWMFNVDQQDSLAIPLADAGVDFEQTDPYDLPSVMNKADVIFYTPPQSEARTGNALQTWLDLGGKTLVTHSYIPVSLDDGQMLLKTGVQNVLFLGGDHNYSEYMAQPSATPGFFLLPIFKGLTQAVDGSWILPSVASAKVILGTPSKPLLTEIMLPKESAIYYLHERPQDLSADDRKQVVQQLMERIHLPRISIEDTSSPDTVMVHRFCERQTDVVSVWNRSRLNQLGFIGGYGPHLLPDRDAKTWDPHLRPYPYLAPGAQCRTLIPMKSPGAYHIYRFFEDREETVTVGADKLLPLSVTGALMEQFYIVPEGAAMQDEIAALKKHHAEVLPYLLDLPAK